MNWVYLLIAIFAEVIGTSAMKASDGFTKLVPTAIMLTGFLIAFFFLSLAMRTIPIGIAYAVWSGVGIMIITVIGYFVFKQSLDTPALVGLGLILAGVVVINGFSNVAGH